MNKEEAWDAGYCVFVGSHDGRGTVRMNIRRTKRNGKTEYKVITLKFDRSGIRCAYAALKAFADKEREEVQGLPL